MTEVTNNNLGSVELFNTTFDSILVKFAGADTFDAGTILAYDTADNTYVLYVPASNTPSAVLRDELVSTGAGNISQRAIVSGQVRRELLVVDGVGAVTEDDVVALRETGIVALRVEELANQDNQ